MFYPHIEFVILLIFISDRGYFTATIGYDSSSIVPSQAQSALVGAVRRNMLSGVPLYMCVESMPTYVLKHSGIVFWEGKHCPRVLVQASESRPLGLDAQEPICDCPAVMKAVGAYVKEKIHDGYYYWWSCSSCQMRSTRNFLSQEYVHIIKTSFPETLWLVHPRPTPPPLYWTAQAK